MSTGKITRKETADVAAIVAGITRLAFSIRYRGLRLRFRIEPRRLAIRADPGGRAASLGVLGERLRIKPGGRIERSMNGGGKAARRQRIAGGSS